MGVKENQIRPKYTYVIVEPGSTPERQLTRMIDMIGIAMEAGASAIKFQWTSSPERMVERRRVPIDYLDSYRLIAFPLEWFPILRAVCGDCDIDLGCTVYLPEDIDKVAQYVRFFKISSFESGLREMQASMEEYSTIPKLVSLGARTHEEVKAIKQAIPVEVRAQYQWLHCISAYPAPQDMLQLGVLHGGEYDGFSDHSRMITTGGVAVAAGASILECHACHPKTPKTNKDFIVSLSPKELQGYISHVRTIEEMLWHHHSSERALLGVEAGMRRYQVDPDHFGTP